MISTTSFGGLILLATTLFVYLIWRGARVGKKTGGRSGDVLGALVVFSVLIFFFGLEVGINKVVSPAKPYIYQLSSGVEYTVVAEYRDGKSFVIIVSSRKKNKMRNLHVIRVRMAPPSKYFMLDGDGSPVSLLPPPQKK